MVRFNEYNEIINNLIKNLGKSDLDLIKILKDLIKDLLATQLSKFSFVKGLDFETLSEELALDIYLQIKEGKLSHVKYWSAYLKRHLLSEIRKKYKDPRNKEIVLETMREKQVEIDSLKAFKERAYEEIESVIEMIKVLFSYLSEPEIRILISLAIESKFNLFDRVATKNKKRSKVLKTLLKEIYYYTRKEVVRVSKRKVSNNSLMRALAGIMISPLFLVLDLESMAKLVATLGGQTIRIPSVSELRTIVPVLVLFYDYKIEGLSLEKLAKKYNLNKKDAKLILEVLENIELSEVERKNLIIALSKLVDMINAQDSFISQRLSEIEEKVRNNSETVAEIYKALLKEEVEGFEGVMKLVNEVVKHISK